MSALQPEGWAAPKGYANGIVATGRMLFTAGQIGWNPRVSKPEYAEGFAAQFEQALSNVCEVVKAAGGAAEHLTRLTIYVTDKKAYLSSLKEIGVSWRTLLGGHYPAVALVQVVALVEDWAMVEIEGTAVLP